MIRVVVCMFLATVPVIAVEPSGEPKHLNDAVKLVRSLRLANTHYNHGEPDVRWKGDKGVRESLVHTDCSGFMDALFARCYGYDRADYLRWFGKKRPTADTYHDAIVKENGFENIHSIQNLQPGDLLAVKYLTKRTDTGHVMLAAGAPKRISARGPMVENTEQWKVRIIDCSKSGHGLSDTRHHRGIDGKDHTGLGVGYLRIYVYTQGPDAGHIAGWSWSTRPKSPFLAPSDEDLVVGRLKSEFNP